MTLAFIDYSVYDQLTWVVEQRIAAIYVHNKCADGEPTDVVEPYCWYRRNNVTNGYQKYSVEALQQIPVSYSSSNGFVVFFTSEDTVHTAFLKILKLEYQTAIIKGMLEFQDGSQHLLNMDLTGN